MYKLTLSLAERQAIDFVGGRYSNGHSLYRQLWVECDEHSPTDADWDYDGEITFDVPEHVAWRISDIGDADWNQWPLFAPELKAKMEDFVNSIV